MKKSSFRPAAGPPRYSSGTGNRKDARMPLTSQDVRGVQFGKSVVGRHGYNPSEVDAFLERAARALTLLLSGQAAELTPEMVRNVAFTTAPLGTRGYHEDEVDSFLEIVEAELLRLAEGGPAIPNQPSAPPSSGPHGAGSEPTVAEPLHQPKPWWRFWN